MSILRRVRIGIGYIYTDINNSLEAKVLCTIIFFLGCGYLLSFTPWSVGDINIDAKANVLSISIINGIVIACNVAAVLYIAMIICKLWKYLKCIWLRTRTE